MPSDEYEDDTVEVSAAALTSSSSSSSSAAPKAKLPARTFPALPGVALPAAALHPKLVVEAPSGAGRDASTVIYSRGERGEAALELRNMEPSAAQQALRDFSHLYPQRVLKWNKGYLNELAYAERSKAIAEKHREEGRRKLLAEEKAALPKKSKGGEESSETFFDRCAAMDRRLQEARVTAIEAHEKASRPKPTKHKWAEVQGSFLKRWTEFNAKSAKNLEELDLKTRPTFRLPGQEPKVWADVADSFFESQQKALDKIKEREEAAEAAEKKGMEKMKVEGIKVKPYNFSKPLPDFNARQAKFAERLSMSYEERLEKYS